METVLLIGEDPPFPPLPRAPPAACRQMLFGHPLQACSYKSILRFIPYIGPAIIKQFEATYMYLLSLIILNLAY